MSDDLLSGLEELVDIPNELWNEEQGTLYWIKALDELKSYAGFVEDKDFANYLNISQATLSDFRREKSEINARIKCQILNYLGFSHATSLIKFLLHDEIAASMRRTTIRQANKIAAVNAKKLLQEEDTSLE